MKVIDGKEALNSYVKIHQLEDVLLPEWLKECHLHVFEKGEFICEFDMDANYFFFFVEGKAKIYTLLSNGKKFLLRFYTPFKILGDVEVINCNKYKVFAQALNTCTCIALPMKIARTQGLKSPEFLKLLCEHLVEKLDIITAKISVNLLFSVEERLAAYVLESAHPHNHTFLLQSSYSDLAEALGTSYRHLNRTMTTLTREGIIEKQGKTIKVIDQARLNAIVSGIEAHERMKI